MNSLVSVDIDKKEGKFKYILIKAKHRQSGETKFIVRGCASCEYHADIFDMVEEKVGKDFALNCVGGGRISHMPSQKKIVVYGYSIGFGKADHAKSTEILNCVFPDYEITWSNEGY